MADPLSRLILHAKQPLPPGSSCMRQDFIWTRQHVRCTIEHIVHKPEAFSRVLIDQALTESGWNLLDSRQVRLELNTATGRADYVLLGPHGPLCVLEAKREDADPYEAKEQARGYAENMKAPFVHDVERARALVLELRACRRTGHVPDRADAVASRPGAAALQEPETPAAAFNRGC